MRLFIPRKRHGDNVELDVNYPQEEEFAIGSKHELSYYYFWFFPEKWKEYYEKYIRFEGIKDKQKRKWQKDYRIVILKALQNTRKQVFLSKNPPNTGRIKQLLETFPDAKFIHIHRNPVKVFLSTRHFLHKMLPALQFHSLSDQESDEAIFNIYKMMMDRYFQERELIPQDNFIEVSFEDLEQKPLENLQKVYADLELKGYEEAIPAFEVFLNSSKGYKKNVHKISRSTLDRVISEWNFVMKEYNYKIPDDVIIED
jgi:hypothetical protein